MSKFNENMHKDCTLSVLKETALNVWKLPYGNEVEFWCKLYGLSSCKRPPLISDHLSLTFWVVAYGRFDSSTMVEIIRLSLKAPKPFE